MLARRRFLAASALGVGAGVSGFAGQALAHVVNDGAVTMARGYTQCRYGQLHFLRGMPASVVTHFPALVLLHQNPSSSVEYEKLVAELAKDREVIAFDTPGSGMSDWPPAPMGLDGYALAFSDGIDAMGLARRAPVDVFGYHTGTFLAAELAIARPDAVGRVVMSGIPYRTAAERAERLAAIDNGPKLTEDGAQILANQRLLWQFVVGARDKRVPLDRAAQLYMEKAKPMDRYWWPYRGVWTYDVEDRFPRITQPLLVVQPHEALLRQSIAAAALVADSRVAELPELDRDIFEVGVDDVAREMRAFLD